MMMQSAEEQATPSEYEEVELDSEDKHANMEEQNRFTEPYVEPTESSAVNDFQHELVSETFHTFETHHVVDESNAKFIAEELFPSKTASRDNWESPNSSGGRVFFPSKSAEGTNEK
jgi:hypothetical protein